MIKKALAGAALVVAAMALGTPSAMANGNDNDHRGGRDDRDHRYCDVCNSFSATEWFKGGFIELESAGGSEISGGNISGGRQVEGRW
ncbi:hypothetical protein NX801_20250 [Streptomyces sp. LP05-1]|uniref:Uncharacterized protein n=1 Tax=Streptomyces pyxinae TaxID=2970734 RepID=A0ABT2CKJ4_9ACTN|nr:hypothetical protein [Streptomyces sp. LP05-1]MCS0637944.1 hypothetical protein [Streptomyces sp. LP05-1]